MTSNLKNTKTKIPLHKPPKVYTKLNFSPEKYYSPNNCETATQTYSLPLIISSRIKIPKKQIQISLDFITPTKTSKRLSRNTSKKNVQVKPDDYDKIFNPPSHCFKSQVKQIIDNKLNIAGVDNERQLSRNYKKNKKVHYLSCQGDNKKKVKYVKNTVHFMKNVIDYTYPEIAFTTLRNIFDKRKKNKNALFNSITIENCVSEENKKKEIHRKVSNFLSHAIKVKKIPL